MSPGREDRLFCRKFVARSKSPRPVGVGLDILLNGVMGSEAIDDVGELEKKDVRLGSSSDSSGALSWSLSATSFEMGRVTDLVSASKLKSQLEGRELRSFNSNLKLRELFLGL